MSVKETVQAAKNANKSVKDIKDESEKANGLDLDLTSKFEADGEDDTIPL